MRLQHELPLEPEPLLEVFELGEEVDDLVRHVADRAHAGEGAAEPGRVSGGQIVQVQHFALEVEVQLSTEEAGQVLVDEVVEAVLRRVALEVLLEHRPLAVGFGGYARGQPCQPLLIEALETQDAFRRRLVDAGLLVGAVARKPLLLAVRQRTVLEADDEIVALDGHRRRSGENKAALPAGRLLDIVLLVVGARDLEAHAPPTVPGREDVGSVVLRRLDVVLVGVRPVELHLLTVVGDEIGRPAAARVAALRHEVAFGVIAGEEAGEVAVDVRLGLRVRPGVGDLSAEILDTFRFFRVGNPQVSERGKRGPQLLVQPGPILGRDPLQRVLHLGQQIVVQERGDLPRLQVHDPVQAEVEVPAIELEHLAEEGPQPVELLLGSRGGTRVATRRVGRRRIAHRRQRGRVWKGVGNPLSSMNPLETTDGAEEPRQDIGLTSIT